MPTDRAFLAENRRQSTRLRTLVDRLTDADLGRPVSHGWTVAETLLHLAFWDLRAAVLIERFARLGAAPSPADVEVLNDTVHAMTTAFPPRAVARLAVEAAARVDQGLQSMPDHLMEAVPAMGHPFSLTRHVHRAEHLDEIDRALEKR